MDTIYVDMCDRGKLGEVKEVNQLNLYRNTVGLVCLFRVYVYLEYQYQYVSAKLNLWRGGEVG